jgi:AbiTii
MEQRMNLINELQVSAENDDVLTVLRKTKRLASKLDQRGIADWLRAEESGYSPGRDVPEYRMINNALAYSTNGYVPAGYGYLKSGIEEMPWGGFTPPPMPLRDSISSVLWLIESCSTNVNGMYFPIEEGTALSTTIRSHFQFDPRFARQITFLLRLNQVQVKAIPERIKDKVLDWACALETAGVNGDGVSFSAKEREISHSITFNITGSNIEQLNNLGTNQKGVQ